ncbi:MAG: TonB-dependent receptor plug domain-containing protein [Gammaproteobacteria bacterium]
MSNSGNISANEDFQQTQSNQAAENQNDIVIYNTNFFDQYQPQTALDMVRQVPGFQLDESSNDTRGFSSATGNFLINDKRPSSKKDQAVTILSRIPATNIERIELIRGQVRGIDLQGQSALINIILRAETPTAIKWEANLLKPFSHGPLTPSVNVSLTDNWNEIEYNTGISIAKNSFGRTGLDDFFDNNGNLTEKRFDDRENRSTFFKGNFHAVAMIDDRILVNINSIIAHDKRNQFLISDRVPQTTGSSPREETFEERFDKPNIEFGLDAESSLSSNFMGKAILLYYHVNDESYKSQRVHNAEGIQTSFRIAEGKAIGTEYIARLEFDWMGLENHSIQANVERVYNSLDGSLVQTLYTGSGPVIIEVPGANSFVKEARWDFLLQDTWSNGNIELDYGLGAELSTISQSGDADQVRNFFFLKPQATLSYSLEQGNQTRFRIAREVSQLNLTDFVSATIFEEDDLALGNPDLRPDTTWISELSHERRFGRITVIKVTTFHHWISNVLDLLPITPNFETPGNIGNGRRWGAKLESTIPLEILGMPGSKLDIKARWQDSTVVDPVTGKNRVLSSSGGDFPISYDVENKYAVSINYRQDFKLLRMAWGWNIITRAERPLFKVNELEIYDEKFQLGTFIETTRWLGVKIRFATINILNSPGYRNRTVFNGQRDLGPVIFRELRERSRGRSATLTFSGIF